MSTDWHCRTLRCRECGSEGKLSTWMDDWCRWGIGELTGFKGRVYVIDSEYRGLSCEKCGADGPVKVDDTS